MIRNLVLILSFILITGCQVFPQEKPRFLTLNGYVSTMQSVTYDSISGPFVIDNLIHNRLNFKGYVNDKITFAAEFRNRFYTGDMVRSGRSYSEMIGTDQGWVDMSWNVLNPENSRQGSEGRGSTGDRHLYGTRMIFSMPIHSLILIMLKGPGVMQ
jgi:hypothetical protein